MKNIFDEIKLQWEGREYIVPARQVMEAIAAIEGHITLQELTQYAARGTAPMGRLANAYAAVLRVAGASITDAEVYLGMFKGNTDHNMISNTVNGLLFMMIPPEVRKRVEDGKPMVAPVLANGQEDPQKGNRVPPVTARSRSTTKRQSGKGGARRQSSGG